MEPAQRAPGRSAPRAAAVRPSTRSASPFRRAPRASRSHGTSSRVKGLGYVLQRRHGRLGRRRRGLPDRPRGLRRHDLHAGQSSRRRPTAFSRAGRTSFRLARKGASAVLPPLPYPAYLSIVCWNGGNDNSFPSSVHVDAIQFWGSGEFRLSITAPFGPGSIQVQNTRRRPGNGYWTAVTLDPGSFPNGWLFGLDITAGELLSARLQSGVPFSGTLNASGISTFTLPAESRTVQHLRGQSAVPGGAPSRRPVPRGFGPGVLRDAVIDGVRPMPSFNRNTTEIAMSRTFLLHCLVLAAASIGRVRPARPGRPRATTPRTAHLRLDAGRHELAGGASLLAHARRPPRRDQRRRRADLHPGSIWRCRGTAATGSACPTMRRRASGRGTAESPSLYTNFCPSEPNNFGGVEDYVEIFPAYAGGPPCWNDDQSPYTGTGVPPTQAIIELPYGDRVNFDYVPPISLGPACVCPFPTPLGATTHPEGVSWNGASSRTAANPFLRSTPGRRACRCPGRQYLRIPGLRASARCHSEARSLRPVPPGVNEVRVAIPPGTKGVSFAWEFIRSTPGPDLNDGVDISVVDGAGALIANLAYADCRIALGTVARPRRSAAVDAAESTIMPAGPAIASAALPPLPDPAYLSIVCWNGEAWQHPPRASCTSMRSSSGAKGQFRLKHHARRSDRVRSGSRTSGGGPGNTYWTAVTLDQGSFPFGWLFGLDIRRPQLIQQVGLGVPFAGTLDAGGISTFTLAERRPARPSGLRGEPPVRRSRPHRELVPRRFGPEALRHSVT